MVDLSFLDQPVERDPHPSQLDPGELMAQCRQTKSRTSGPGGQHRNKVETAVTLTHGPTGVSAQASERRSAEENRKVALTRLRLRLAVEVRCPVPSGDARSALWRSRTKGGRVSCNPGHADYPALLAEAMDVLDACGWDQHKAAMRLEVTPTQLVRFVGEHAPALAAWNARREGLGLRTLR